MVVKLGVLASSLKPQGNVHYFVMNAFCRLLFHRKHPKKSYKHYFFSKVGVSVILPFSPSIKCSNYINEIILSNLFL